jgi:hypothetical protein
MDVRRNISMLRRLFGQGDGLPAVSKESREYLNGICRQEIEELQELLQTAQSCWA